MKRINREPDFDAEYEELFGDRSKNHRVETLREKDSVNHKSKFYKTGGFHAILICAVIAVILVAVFARNNDSEAEIPIANNPEQTETTEAVTETVNLETEPAETEPMVEVTEPEEINPFERDNSSAELTSLPSGTFIVGEDIPPGRYIISADGSGNLFLRRNGRSFVNEILGDGEWGVSTVTTYLENGDEIEIGGINLVTFEPTETILLTTLTTGDWIVGIDILAGSYQVLAINDEDSGNFFVRRNGRSIANEILGGNFGEAYISVTLEDGDVVTISRLNAVIFNLN